MKGPEETPSPEASPAEAEPAANEGRSLIGVPLPAEVLQSDPGILSDSVRGSGSPPGAIRFQGDPEQRR